MKLSILLVMAAVLLNSLYVSAQKDSKGEKENDLAHKNIVITGCLTKNSLNEFELVDQDGFDNLPYSSIVHLDEYVGQTVTLVGRRAATPSVETHPRGGTHFLVKKVQSASGQCKK